MQWFFAAPFGVNCEFIGNCSAKTRTIDMAFANASNLIIGIIGMLAIVFIIYGGIQFALSNGNPKQVQEAKSTLTYAIGGLVLAIVAYAVVAFVVGAISTGTVK